MVTSNALNWRLTRVSSSTAFKMEGNAGWTRPTRMTMINTEYLVIVSGTRADPGQTACTRLTVSISLVYTVPNMG